jgi:hypothetical protein
MHCSVSHQLKDSFSLLGISAVLSVTWYMVLNNADGFMAIVLHPLLHYPRRCTKRYVLCNFLFVFNARRFYL